MNIKFLSHKSDIERMTISVWRKRQIERILKDVSYEPLYTLVFILYFGSFSIHFLYDVCRCNALHFASFFSQINSFFDRKHFLLVIFLLVNSFNYLFGLIVIFAY